MKNKRSKLFLALAVLLGSTSVAMAVQAVSTPETTTAIRGSQSVPTVAGTVIVLSPVANSEVAPAESGSTFLPYIVGGEINPTIGISQTATLPPEGAPTSSTTVSISSTETLVPVQNTATPSPSLTSTPIPVATSTPSRTPSATKVVTTPFQFQIGLWQDLSDSDVRIQFYVNSDRITLSSVAIAITSCGKTFNLPLGEIKNNSFTIVGGSDEAGLKAQIIGQFTSAITANGTWRIEGSTGCNSTLLSGTWTAYPTP